MVAKLPIALRRRRPPDIRGPYFVTFAYFLRKEKPAAIRIMMAMPAPVLSLPSSAQQETVDFLRRLSSMLTGGRNAEMLQEAAAMIETLSRRASPAQEPVQNQQE